MSMILAGPLHIHIIYQVEVHYEIKAIKRTMINDHLKRY